MTFALSGEQLADAVSLAAGYKDRSLINGIQDAIWLAEGPKGFVAELERR